MKHLKKFNNYKVNEGLFDFFKKTAFELLKSSKDIVVKSEDGEELFWFYPEMMDGLKKKMPNATYFLIQWNDPTNNSTLEIEIGNDVDLEQTIQSAVIEKYGNEKKY